MPVKNPSHLDDALKSINYCQCSLSYNNKKLYHFNAVYTRTYICMHVGMYMWLCSAVTCIIN